MERDDRWYALIVASTAYHIDKFTWGQIRILQKMGFKVHVAAGFDAKLSGNSSGKYIDDCRDRFICQGVIIHELSFTRFPISLSNLSALRALKKLLKKYSYSLLHCHTPTGGLIARICAARYRKKGLRVIYTVHGFHFYKGAPLKNWLLYYPVERYLARVTDCLIVINKEDEETAHKMTAKRVVKMNGVGVSCVPYENCAAIDKAVLSLPPGAFVFLCVGELSQSKNQGLLIRSFSKISQDCPDAALLLAGEGSLRASYTQLAMSLDLGQRVRFLGWREDIPELVLMADVIVSASIREGLPVNLIEAMLAGKPVIASPCRGNRELAEQAGIIADGEKAFSEAMVLLYQNAELRSRLGKAAKSASEQYEAGVIDVKMEEVYRSLL